MYGVIGCVAVRWRHVRQRTEGGGFFCRIRSENLTVWIISLTFFFLLIYWIFYFIFFTFSWHLESLTERMVFWRDRTVNGGMGWIKCLNCYYSSTWRWVGDRLSGWGMGLGWQLFGLTGSGARPRKKNTLKKRAWVKLDSKSLTCTIYGTHFYFEILFLLSCMYCLTAWFVIINTYIYIYEQSTTEVLK